MVGCPFLTTHEYRKVRSIFLFWEHLCPAIFWMQASPNLGRTICPRGPALFQELMASAVSNLEQFLAVHYMTIAGKQRSRYGVFTPYYVLGATDKRGHASSTVTRFRISLRISMFNHASKRIRFNARLQPIQPARRAVGGRAALLRTSVQLLTVQREKVLR